jgi:autotransporter-associated beta strand protein
MEPLNVTRVWLRHRAFVLIAVCLVFMAPCFAAPDTWTGQKGANGSNWDSKQNWSTGVPTLTADAIFGDGLGAAYPSLVMGTDMANTVTFGGTTSYTFGTGSLTINAGITNNSTALQTFNVGMVLGGSQTWTTSSQGGLAFNTINLSNGNTAQTLTISGPGTTTVTGTVANGGTAAGSLSMNGTGTLVLSGANTYTGGTTISSGTVEIGADSAFGTGSVTLNGGTIRAGGGARNLGNSIAAGGDFAIGGSNSLTLNGTLNLTGSTRTITVDNTGITTVSGAITQTSYSSLVKSGSGTLVLSGNNTYSGPTSVNAGTLVLANNNALGAQGTWNHLVSTGATLALQGGITVNQGGFNINGTGVNNGGAIRNLSGNNTLGGQIALGSAASLASDSGTLTFTGDMIASSPLTFTGAGNMTASGAINGNTITKSGTGTLTFSGASANSFSNLAINDGTVIFAKTAGTNAMGGGTLTIGDGVGSASSAVLQLGASNQVPDYATITMNSDGRFNLNNYVESINTITGTGRIDLGNTGTLTVGVNSGSSTFSGSLAGTGTLIKTGSGTFTLGAGMNLAGGSLVLAGGTLNLGGFTSTFGSLAVTASSVIDFTGNSTLSILGSLTVSNGATLTIQDWTNGVDYFYSANNPFPIAGQIVFSGYSASDTKWQSLDREITPITPVPEPEAYGAIFMFAGFCCVVLRRLKQSDSVRV